MPAQVGLPAGAVVPGEPYPPPLFTLPPVAPLLAELRAAGRSSYLVTADDKCYFVMKRVSGTLMGETQKALVFIKDSPDADFRPTAPHQYVCIKVVQKECMRRGVNLAGTTVLENPLKEVWAFAHLQARWGTAGGGGGGHPNLLRLLGFYEDETRYFIVLEWLDGGDVFSVIEHQPMPEEDARKLAFGALRAAAFLADAGLAHRDISPENIMLTGALATPAGTPKVIDFGQVLETPASGGPLAPAMCGKTNYRPHEVQAGLAYNGWAVDVWEIGATLFTCLFGINPYAIALPALCPQYAAIARGQLKDLLRHWGLYDRVSPAAIDLLDQLMKHDPAARVSAAAALRHPWFEGMA